MLDGKNNQPKGTMEINGPANLDPFLRVLRSCVRHGIELPRILIIAQLLRTAAGMGSEIRPWVDEYT